MAHEPGCTTAPHDGQCAPELDRLVDPHDCYPDAFGMRCVVCGRKAEPVDPDELAQAFDAAYRALPVKGQTSWLD